MTRSRAACQPAAEAWSPRRHDGNNFDFLRFFFASLVIYFHSFLILLGKRLGPAHETVTLLTRGQVNGGALAVDAFFAISGFLIVHSWVTSQSFGSFLVKRALRIYPGYLLAAAISFLLFAPLAALPGHGGATSIHYRWALLAALTLQETRMIGVVANRFGDLFWINSVTWTIGYEFWCYMGVALLGVLGCYRRPYRALLLFTGYLLLYSLPDRWLTPMNGYSPFLLYGLVPVPLFGPWSRLATFFLSGVCFYLHRAYIPPSRRLFWLSLGALATFAAMGHGLRTMLPLLGTYVLFSVAFSRRLRLSQFGRRGDLSYGIYLYGWPIQILLALYLPKHLNPYTLTLLAFPITACFAALSWHLVEQPCLRLKPLDKLRTARSLPQDPLAGRSGTSISPDVNGSHGPAAPPHPGRPLGREVLEER